MNRKKLFSLENFIYLIIFSIPLYLIRLKAGFFSVNLLDIMIAAAFVLWISKSRLREIKNLWAKHKKYVLGASSIFLGLVFSAVSSIYVNDYVIDYVHSIGIIAEWFLIPIIFSLLVFSVVPGERRGNIFLAYCFSASAAALIALGYKLTGCLAYDGRLEGIFNSPNYLAMYLSPALITAIAQISNIKFQTTSLARRQVLHRTVPGQADKLQIRNSKYKALLIAAGGSFFLITSAAFYFTYSYAAWISVALALLAVFIAKKNISWRKIILFVVILLILFSFQFKNEKFRDLINMNPRSSLASRMMIWESAGKMLRDHWLFGIGPDKFQEMYLAYQKYFPPYLEWAVPHPHNVHLAFWLYGGVLGISGFLGLILFWFWDFFKMENKKAVHLAAFGIIVYILIHGFFDTTYFKNDLAVVFWLAFTSLFDAVSRRSCL